MQNENNSTVESTTTTTTTLNNLKAAGQAAFGMLIIALWLPVDLAVAGWKKITANTAVKVCAWAILGYSVVYTTLALTPTNVGQGIRYWGALSMERSLDGDYSGAYSAWGKSLVFTPRPGIFTRAANALW